MSNKESFSHEKAVMQTDEWLTPPSILKALGSFALDPCAPITRPWDTAKKHYTIEDDGLKQKWKGRVWLNPPYGKHTVKWLKKLWQHGDGIALIFARTETVMFKKLVWDRADAVLFIEGRIHFHKVNGKRSRNSGGAPSVLIAYGERNAKVLERSTIKGQFLKLNHKVNNLEIWDKVEN